MTSTVLNANVLAFAEMTVSLDPQRANLPFDYFQKVAKRGDEYRDAFTKVLLYLSSLAEVQEMDCVIASVLDGNKSALEAFEYSCRPSNAYPPAASHFALATTSAGATSVNIHRQAKGGCFTISTPGRVVEHGLLLSQLYFRTYDAGDAHLFLEGRDDGHPGNLTVLYVKFGRSSPSSFEFTFQDPHLDPNDSKPVRYRRYAEFFGDLLCSPPFRPVYATVHDDGFDTAPLTAQRGSA